jgi:hypothetical protein
MAIWNLESDQIPVFFPITGAWILGHMSILGNFWPPNSRIPVPREHTPNGFQRKEIVHYSLHLEEGESWYAFNPLPLLGRATTRLLCDELLKKNDGH